MTTKLPDWARRLAADFLREYRERLSNDGCNDYDVPDWVPLPELQAALVTWNNGTPEDAEGLESTNWAVVGAVADLLSPEIKP